MATRVIDSPRERLIATLTNNFSLCNGRWPTQILIATIFIGQPGSSGPGRAGVGRGRDGGGPFGRRVHLPGVPGGCPAPCSRERLRPSAWSCPPYRPPRILQTIYTSLIDRTLIVLWRAVVFSVPAGAAIWLVSNIHLGGASLAEHLIQGMNPFGLLIGLNGVILLAYIIAIPANEIVIPTVLMLTVVSAGLTGVGEGAGVMFEFDSASATLAVLEADGWTLLTGINLMLFSLLHNPCSTTLYTIWKETGSVKWTAASALLPIAMGLVVCFCVAQAFRWLGG